MKDFAKLYRIEEFGQVLVTKETNEDGAPEVSLKFSPPGLGVCKTAYCFDDSESGWDAAEELFDNIVSEDWAAAILRDVFERATQFVAD